MNVITADNLEPAGFSASAAILLTYFSRHISAKTPDRLPLKIRDYFVYGPSQWEVILHCIVTSFWLRTYTKCLAAPSHYLDQCWLIVSRVEWHSSKGKFTRDTSAINDWNRVPTKISEKSSMIFPWLLQAKIQISRQKNPNICFCGPLIKL